MTSGLPVAREEPPQLATNFPEALIALTIFVEVIVVLGTVVVGGDEISYVGVNR